jgi:DNA-binding NarL/FixJ family response regulator
MTTVLLADDHELVRHGLQHVLEHDGGFEVVGAVRTVRDAVVEVRSRLADVAVVGSWMSDGSALDAAEQLRAVRPQLGIVVLTAHDDDVDRTRALESGASCAVCRNARAEEIVAATRLAAVAPVLPDARRWPGRSTRRTNGRQRPRLSRRECEVLALLAEGLAAAQIARQLFISESTTKTHISHLYDKLGAGNRAQALMSALRLGLLEQPERI